MCVLAWQCHGKFTFAVLFALTILFGIDIMLFFFVSNLLHKLQAAGGVMWPWLLFWPPLAQPLGLLIGFAFLFLERPRFGRIFALFSLFGLANSAYVTVLCLTLLQWESWLFDLGLLLFSWVLKMSLFVCANLHVANLEFNFDERQVEAAAEMVPHHEHDVHTGYTGHPRQHRARVASPFPSAVMHGSQVSHGHQRFSQISQASAASRGGSGEQRAQPQQHQPLAAQPVTVSEDRRAPESSQTMLRAFPVPRASTAVQGVPSLTMDTPDAISSASPF